ncbi:phage protein [Bacillus cereus VD133]|uniref:Phage protein n=1 Tax=Bacillus cereus VD133 TaxID=1053233 RepID=A0A9W5V4R1_BACCE|nr:phage protein [Bacillus cereus VD133]
MREVRLTAESEGAKVEERIEAIEYELAHKMNDVFDLKKLICKFKGLDHQILKLKYMDGLTLASIASELNYNPDYIRQRHAEVMRIVKFVDAL